MTFLKKISLFLLVLAAAATWTSCNDGNGKEVSIPVPDDSSALAKINHFIPRSTIDLYKRDFKTANDSQALKNPALHIPESEAFNKPGVLEILKDPKCVGIKIYYGVKKGQRGDEIRLILVGVDSNGKELYILDGGKAAQAATQADGREGGIEMGQCPTCLN